MKLFHSICVAAASLVVALPGVGLAQNWNLPVNSPYYMPGAAPQTPLNNNICGPYGCPVNCGPNGCDWNAFPQQNPAPFGNSLMNGSSPYFSPQPGALPLPHFPNGNLPSGGYGTPYFPGAGQTPGQMQTLPYVPELRTREFPPANGGFVGNLQIPASMWGLAELPLHEQQAALQQRVCPISGDLLGSRGKPVRVMLNGVSTFVCCQSCADAVRTRGFPEQHLIHYQPGNNGFPQTYPAAGVTLH